MSLLKTWKEWKADGAPYILPDDAPILERLKGQVTQTWAESYPAPDFGAPGDRRLHLGLLPHPFCGDIVNASIYVLMLNPGVGYQDYFGEYNVPEYRAALLAGLRQEFVPDLLLFMFLDPQFSWHGGFNWWHAKLVRVIQNLAEIWSATFAEARAHLARKLASIELVPYHSEHFSNAGGLAKKLPSAQLAAKFVHEFVLPKVRSGKAIVIVARRVQVWNLPEEAGVIKYSGGEARGAHLGPETRGGRAILEHLSTLAPPIHTP